MKAPSTVFSVFLFLVLAFAGGGLLAGEPPIELEIDARHFGLRDVFELEVADDPRLAPDGQSIVYVRRFMDIQSDRRRSNLWTVGSDGSGHRPLTSGLQNDTSPRFSPDGGRLLYVSQAPEDGSAELWVRWLASGETARLTQLPAAPGGLAWSPDGRMIAFSMFVEERKPAFVKLPKAPEGASWADPAVIVDDLVYRRDGGGYIEKGSRQLFIVSADGGTPRQVTSGPYDHDGTPAWTPDGNALVFSANRHDNWRREPRNSEIYELRLDDGELRSLTDRFGPDTAPALSPDGRHVAYVGFDDRFQGYQVSKLYVLDREAGGPPRLLAESLDRTIEEHRWSPEGDGFYVRYDDHGNGKIAFVSLALGEVEIVAEDVAGTALGRPYGGGAFTVGAKGRVAFTRGRPERPADVAVLDGRGVEVQQLTHLNDDLFGTGLGQKRLGEVEEIRYKSSKDGREIQGWIVKPPGFDSAGNDSAGNDPAKRYPLILEIHGGPFANYGDRFAAEAQLYAAAGYVVLYTNPRGSTSYGEEFGNLIHHAYPGDDYFDLMSGVDAVLERGYVDPERLFVTGGSGGGVLTAWIVGRTDRFRAAVVAKPVINWTSFVLTADNANFYYRYWFPGFPWDHPEHYRARSPLSLVSAVTTPTMLLTGESDFRTPIAETEQYYQALRLRGVDTVMVRMPGAYHHIARRPSQMMSKAAHILAWFERYRGR